MLVEGNWVYRSRDCAGEEGHSTLLEWFLDDVDVVRRTLRPFIQRFEVGKHPVSRVLSKHSFQQRAEVFKLVRIVRQTKLPGSATNE